MIGNTIQSAKIDKTWAMRDRMMANAKAYIETSCFITDNVEA